MGGRILVDDRWTGRHGIGRFAAEVLGRIEGTEGVAERLKLSPLHPLNPWHLAREIGRRRPDVFFSPGFNPPGPIPCPFVFCLHDLVHLEVAGESSAAKRLYYRLVVKPATRRAAAIVTLSEFSRSRIIALMGVPPEKVFIVGCGVHPVFRPEGPRASALRPYLLWVGNHRSHKNTDRMLAAFARSRARESCDLLLVAYPTVAARRKAADLGIADRAIWRSDVEDEQLAALYRGAAGLLQPSLVEGFGLPVLEAMACGTPALIADATALTEVAGDAALPVDPLDVDALAAGIDRLVEDEPLRRQLSMRGIERAACFTWDQTAERVRRILEQAMAGPIATG